MNKIWLITQREYTTRVKSKTFLLTTFLAPLGMVALIAVVAFLMTRGSDKKKIIAVLDNASIVSESQNEQRNLTFIRETRTLNDLFVAYENGDYDGILELPPIDSSQQSYDIIYHSDEQLALDEMSTIEGMYRRKVRNFKIQAFGIDEAQLNLIDTDITVEPKTIKDKDKEISSITAAVTSTLGGIVGYALFFIILIYGGQVMRSVMEEKINRIVEVLISSVKPFELMMGKVMGVGLVGLTQIGIWLILLFGASTFLGASFLDVSGASEIAGGGLMENMPASPASADKISAILSEVFAVNWLLVVPLFIFYFLIGYFTYAALFAAVGSAIGDDINEAQSITIIVMLPLLLAVYIGLAAIQAPNSSLSVWSSMAPFTSPVVMPVRLPTDPPGWQIMVSMIIAVAFAIGMVWFAGRIYRVGILMYGKKASLKELAKWLFYQP